MECMQLGKKLEYMLKAMLKHSREVINRLLKAMEPEEVAQCRRRGF
jgi:hypothetical protein